MGQDHDLQPDMARLDPRRLRSPGGRRRKAEHILSLAEHLDPADRFLIRQLYEFGLRVTDIAQQSGRSHSAVYHHIWRLLARLESRRFRYLVARLDLLPPALAQTARQVVCRGLTMRQVAAETGRKLHEVRREMQAFEALVYMA